MDKTAQTEFYRSYLFSNLPEPLKPANSHLQIFDNYIKDTRLRLRKIRVPETKEWTWLFQQNHELNSKEIGIRKYAEICLSETEYKKFDQFRGREIRKNRYLHEVQGIELEFDIYLGNLWGLNLMQVRFETVNEMRTFESPHPVILDVTGQEFFTGANLVSKTFSDVQVEFERIEGKGAGGK